MSGLNTIILDRLEFRFEGAPVVNAGGLVKFEMREYVVWTGAGNDAAPVDRFQVFRAKPGQLWTAWCADTYRPERREWRRALADHLNGGAK